MAKTAKSAFRKVSFDARAEAERMLDNVREIVRDALGDEDKQSEARGAYYSTFQQGVRGSKFLKAQAKALRPFLVMILGPRQVSELEKTARSRA